MQNSELWKDPTGQVFRRHSVRSTGNFAAVAVVAEAAVVGAAAIAAAVAAIVAAAEPRR